MSHNPFTPRGDFEYFVVEKMFPVFGCIAGMTFNGLTMDSMLGLSDLLRQADSACDDDVAAQQLVTGATRQVVHTLQALVPFMSEEFGNAVADFAGRLFEMEMVSRHFAVS